MKQVDKTRAGLIGAVLAIAALIVGSQVLGPGADSYGGLTLIEAQTAAAQGTAVYVNALSGSTAHGLVRPDDSQQSLDNAHDAGMLTAGYALIGCGSDGAQDMRFARYGQPADPTDDISDATWDRLQFVAIDVEESCDTYYTVLQAVDQLQQWGVRRVVIYTSYNAWVNYLNNPAPPAGVFLWDAWWNGVYGLNTGQHLYGAPPWSIDMVIGQQYQGGSTIDGNALTVIGTQNVDLDIFRLDLLPDWQPCVPHCDTATPTSTPFPEPTPLIVTLTPTPATCSAGDVEWSAGECAHWDPALQAWQSPLRTLVPLADGHQLWFDKEGRLLSP